MNASDTFYPHAQTLRLFCLAVENASLREAAKRAGVTPAAASQAVRALEKNLGVRLFDRRIRPLQLTSEGRLFYEQSAKIVRMTSDMVRSVQALSPLSMDLRLGLSESVSETLGAQIGAALVDRVGSLSMHSAFTAVLARLMLSDRLDVVVCPESFADRSGFVHEAVLTEDYLVVTPKGIPAPNSPEELARLAKNLTYLRFNSESSDRLQAERVYRKLSIPEGKTIAVESSYALTGLVALGKGWALMPPLGILQGREWIDEVNVARLPAPGIRRTQWIVAKSGVFAPLVADIRACVKQTFVQTLMPRIRERLPKLAPYVRTIG